MDAHVKAWSKHVLTRIMGRAMTLDEIQRRMEAAKTLDELMQYWEQGLEALRHEYQSRADTIRTKHNRTGHINTLSKGQ